MKLLKALIPLLFCASLLCACDYIVLPEEEVSQVSAASKGWSALVTNVGKSDAGNLHIDLALRNDTTVWSTMQATADKPATLTKSDGKTASCETVFVSTGGHRLAPGFLVRGYTTGTKAEPKTQMILCRMRRGSARCRAKALL